MHRKGWGARKGAAQAQATSGTDCWGQEFGNNATPPTLAADALANLFYTTVTKCSAPEPRYTVDANNHFADTGMSYDNNGNQTADTVNSYTYDAENRIESTDVGGTYYCYIYDGNGMRVAKATASSSTCSSLTVYELYWRAISGDTIAVSDGSGSTTNSSYHEYIFFAGRRVARSDPSSGNVYYFFVDQVGSTRAMTDQNGSVCFQMDYFPYGQENTPAGVSNTCSTNHLFTGYERDPETGLDYAYARYYNSREARFMSADPLSGNVSNPQSLNRYAYVQDNPTSFTDPTGMFTSGDGGDGGESWWYDSFWYFGPGVYVTYNCFLTYASTGCAPVRHVNEKVNILQPPPNSKTQNLNCTVRKGRTTAVAPGEATGPGVFGLYPSKHPGMVAIDPYAIGFPPGAATNDLLKQYASQITFTFSPTPNLPSGFPTTFTLGDIAGGKPNNPRVGGSAFNGLYDFDFYGLPSLAAARQVSSPSGVPVSVEVRFPSSLPINCGGPLDDPTPLSPGTS